MIRAARTLLPITLFVSCATASVDMSEPRRLVGTESSVRVDVEVGSEELAPGTPVPIICVITNERASAIAVADILPETTWDQESRTFTVAIGSEVPGELTLPRLIAIQPGERKTISVSARIAAVPAPSGDPSKNASALLRVKVNFLGDTAAFGDLIEMTQKALLDPARAEKLFPLWLEHNEAVYTNAVPMRWGGRRSGTDGAPGSVSRRGF